MRDRKPMIVTVGHNGRCVVYGYVEEDPSPNRPIRVYDARMVLCWDSECGGLFGLASLGPAGDTRITFAVPWTTLVCHEALAVTSEAAQSLDAWPGYRG